MFILWIVLIGILIYVFKDRIHVDFENKSKSEAEEILKKRYVEGEIDEETYFRIKKEINK